MVQLKLESGLTVTFGGRRHPHPEAHRGVSFKKVHLTGPQYAHRNVNPPAAINYSNESDTAALAQVYGNDEIGDCVIAGDYHWLGIVTGNATGTAFIATREQIIADYSAISGYVPGDPSTDNGCDEISCFRYRMTQGYANGSILYGYASIDAKDQNETKAAIFLFESAKLDMDLPDEWVQAFSTLKNGDTWDVAGDPNPENSHDVVAVGYDEHGIYICTFGLILRITWAALAKYGAVENGGGFYALLSSEQIEKGKQVAPNGVDWATLEEDIQSIPTGEPGEVTESVHEGETVPSPCLEGGPEPVTAPPVMQEPQTNIVQAVQDYIATAVNPADVAMQVKESVSRPQDKGPAVTVRWVNAHPNANELKHVLSAVLEDWSKHQ